MKKLSVVVPVYKTEKYLKRCIESILNQTYSNIELILVDDGSPDDCGCICDQYAQNDNRIVVIHQKNAGVAAARNKGISIASGEYLTFVDSDDWLDPEMYEKMMEEANKYHCDVIMCDCIKEFSDHSEIYTHDIRPGFYNYEQLKEEYYPHLLMMENVEYPATISNWLIMYRIRESDSFYPASLIRYVEGIRYSEDLLFGAELMLKARSFYYMKGQCYYHYRIYSDSSSHNVALDHWDDYLRLCNITTERFATNSYDFSDQLDKMLLFFVHRALTDIRYAKAFSKSDRLHEQHLVLNTSEVRQMFRRVSICKLPISVKMKVVSLIYKYRIGLRLLMRE